MNDLFLFPTTLFLVLVNVLFSLSGFSSRVVMDHYKFNTYGVLSLKQYYRMVTSGFLHVDWAHLIFNMFVLYEFGRKVETEIGSNVMILLYAVALIAGNTLALIINRKDTAYSAVGASGAVSGVLFTYLSFWPTRKLMLLFLPFPVQGWILGIVYLVVSVYGMQTKRDNIGHEAHLGGAIAGVICAIFIKPNLLTYNYYIWLFLIVPIVIFILQKRGIRFR